MKDLGRSWWWRAKFFMKNYIKFRSNFLGHCINYTVPLHLPTLLQYPLCYRRIKLALSTHKIKIYYFIKALWKISSKHITTNDTLCSDLHKIHNDIYEKLRNRATIMFSYIRNYFFQESEWCVKYEGKYLTRVFSSIHWGERSAHTFFYKRKVPSSP